MDEHQRLFGRQGMRVGGGLRQRFPDQYHVGAPGGRAGDLCRRREFRHHNGGGDTQQTGMTGHRLRVVASRHRNHATFPFGRRQHRQPVGCAAFLKSAGHLQVVELQQHLGAGYLRDGVARDQRRSQHPPSDPFRRAFNILKRDHELPCVIIAAVMAEYVPTIRAPTDEAYAATACSATMRYENPTITVRS